METIRGTGGPYERLGDPRAAAVRHVVALLGDLGALPAAGTVFDFDVDGRRCMLAVGPVTGAATGTRPPAARQSTVEGATRVDGHGDIVPSLTPREREVADLVAQGHTNRTIARALDISEWTVSTHLRRLFGKLEVQSRAAMVARLHELGVHGPHVPDARPAVVRQDVPYERPADVRVPTGPGAA